MSFQDIASAFGAASMNFFRKNPEKELLDIARKAPEKLAEAFRPYVEAQHKVRLNAILSEHRISKEDAEEIVFDGFMILFDNLKKGKFKSKSGLNAYLAGIIRNLVKRFWDRNKALGWENYVENISEAVTNYFANRESEKWEKVERSIQSLSKNCQRILKLFYFEGYNFKEIASQMGLGSADVARTSKHRCLADLHKRLKQ